MLYGPFYNLQNTLENDKNYNSSRDIINDIFLNNYNNLLRLEYLKALYLVLFSFLFILMILWPTFTLPYAFLLTTLPWILQLMIPKAQRTLTMLILLKFNPGLRPLFHVSVSVKRIFLFLPYFKQCLHKIVITHMKIQYLLFKMWWQNFLSYIRVTLQG